MGGSRVYSLSSHVCFVGCFFFFFVYWSVVLRPIREYFAQMKTLLTTKGCVRI